MLPHFLLTLFLIVILTSEIKKFGFSAAFLGLDVPLTVL